jgi:hypothetical protein
MAGHVTFWFLSKEGQEVQIFSLAPDMPELDGGTLMMGTWPVQHRIGSDLAQRMNVNAR